MHDDEYMYRSGDLALSAADDNRKLLKRLAERVSALEEYLHVQPPSENPVPAPTVADAISEWREMQAWQSGEWEHLKEGEED